MWASLAGGDEASEGAGSTADPEPEALDLGILDAAPVDPETGLGLEAEAPQPDAPAAGPADAPAAAPTAGPGPRTTAQASAALEARLDRGAIAEAIEAAAGEEFAVPMRARTFAALSAVALTAVFALGVAVGARSDGATGPATPAGEREGGPDSADGRRVQGGFALPAPRVRDAPAAPAESSESAESSGMPAADRAFLDPANQVSVLAIRYKPSQANIELAWETHATLQAAGFPVVSPVHLEGDRMIYLFIGAAETEAQLMGLLDRVKRFEIGPRGRRDFASAQPVEIDRYR